MRIKKRPRTLRVCIASEVQRIDRDYKYMINSIKKIQLENDITFSDAKFIYEQRTKSPLEQLEYELFGDACSQS